MMRKFVLKEDKIHELKHEKHGVRFTSFAIKAPQKRIQQAKKKYQQINLQRDRKCKIQRKKMAKKVVKYMKYRYFL